jgi:histidyl-tRNA synthetase
MGMGDMVIIELLEELHRLPDARQPLDIYLVDADHELFDRVLQLAARLRQAGCSCQFSYKRQAVGKQLAAASARGARRCVILGNETRQNEAVTIKDLGTGQQAVMQLSRFLESPMQVLD